MRVTNVANGGQMSTAPLSEYLHTRVTGVTGVVCVGAKSGLQEPVKVKD